MTLKRSWIKQSRKPWPSNSADHVKLRRQRKALKKGSSRKLTEWSKTVRERDNHICQMCFGPGGHAHHIAPRSRRPDLKYVLANGVTLCWADHDWVHRNPKEATERGFLSDVPYEMRDEIRGDTELEKAA